MSNFFNTLLAFLIRKRKKVIGLCVAIIVIYFLYTKIIPNLSPFGFALIIIFVLVFLAKWSDITDAERRGKPMPWERPSSSDLPNQTQPPQRSESTIRDRAGNLHARMVTEGHQTRIYDHAGNYHGYYDSITNRTYNHAGNIVAQGNVLATLV